MSCKSSKSNLRSSLSSPQLTAILSLSVSSVRRPEEAGLGLPAVCYQQHTNCIIKSTGTELINSGCAPMCDGLGYFLRMLARYPYTRKNKYLHHNHTTCAISALSILHCFVSPLHHQIPAASSGLLHRIFAAS